MDWVLGLNLASVAIGWCDKKIARNVKITLFSPRWMAWTTQNGKIRGKEKNREKNPPFQQQTEVMIYSFFAAFVEPRKKNWGSDYSHGLKGMVVNKSRPLDSSFFKCRLCWLCWGHLTNQRWGERLGQNRFLLLWKHQFCTSVWTMPWHLFLSYLFKGWHRVMKNRKPSKK